MRLWPFKREARQREQRQAQGGAYTSAVLAQILAQASGGSPDPGATAALEFCAGTWARAFASADIKPSFPQLSPSLLACVGRELVRSGESLFAIDVMRGQISLSVVGSWDVRGGPAPADWFYRTDEYGPSGSRTRLLSGASVLHFRYGIDPARPWAGVSPLGYAYLTGALSGSLELRLSQEANARVGYLLPIPSDGGGGGDDDPHKQLKADLAALQGNLSLVETTSSAWGEGKAAAPQTDWKPQRIGASPPDSLGSLRSDSSHAIMAACGVPASLADPRSEGGGQRESFRRLIHNTIQPAADLVAQELSEKLERPFEFSFSRLMSSDLVGRSRAFSQMVRAGMTLESAAGLTGLLVDDET